MRRRAFTLVEICIGSAVLAILAVGVFRVFGGANKANVQALWYSKAQSQARECLNMIRNDLAKATCPSEVNDNGVVRTPCNGSATQGETDLTGGGSVELLRFEINTPDINVTGDEEDPRNSVCVLTANGTTLHYSRQGDAAPNYDRNMVLDVAKVTIEVRGNAGEAYDQEGSVVEVQLDLKHNNEKLFPNAHLTEKTMARAPIPF